MQNAARATVNIDKKTGTGDTDRGDADAAYRAEVKRIERLITRQMQFVRKYLAAAALTEWPPEDQGADFDEYWQGNGELDGIQYTKSWQYDDEG